jgi:hypothetical protein
MANTARFALPLLSEAQASAEVVAAAVCGDAPGHLCKTAARDNGTEDGKMHAHYSTRSSLRFTRRQL